MAGGIAVDGQIDGQMRSDDPRAVDMLDGGLEEVSIVGGLLEEEIVIGSTHNSVIGSPLAGNIASGGPLEEVKP